MVVSVCKFEEKTLIQKINLRWFLNRNLKNLLTNFFLSNFFFNKFFFQLILTEGTIGNATLNLREGIVISKI